MNLNDKSVKIAGKTYIIIDGGAIRQHGQSEFSIFHHNSRSLDKKANITVDYISIQKHNFNIIGFTDDSNLIDLENYAKIDSIRPNINGGGAFMFIDSKHNFIQRTALNIKSSDCDSVFIEIPDKKYN